MKKENRMAQMIERTEGRSAYDTAAKNLLSFKVIQAKLVKYLISELKDYSLRQIMEMIENAYFKIQYTPASSSQLIRGLDSVDKSIDDGTIFLDLLYSIRLPGQDKGFLINLEIQKRNVSKDGGPKRAFYYVGRITSSEKDTVFHDNRYADMWKVYSIWIHLDSTEDRKNKMNVIKPTQDKERSTFFYKESEIDFFEIVTINLDQTSESDSDLFRFLDYLLNPTRSAEERKRALEEEFEIPMTEDMTKEVDIMALDYPYFMADMKKAHNEELLEQEQKYLATIAQKDQEYSANMAQKDQEYLASKIQMIKNIASASHKSYQESLAMAGVPKDDWPIYLEKLENDSYLAA